MCKMCGGLDENAVGLIFIRDRKVKRAGSKCLTEGVDLEGKWKQLIN